MSYEVTSKNSLTASDFVVYHAALEALVANPLVNSYYNAKGALDELLVAEKEWLPQFSEAISALEKGETPTN